MHKFIILLFMMLANTFLVRSQKIESYTYRLSRSRFTDHANDFHGKEYGEGEIKVGTNNGIQRTSF